MLFRSDTSRKRTFHGAMRIPYTRHTVCSLQTTIDDRGRSVSPNIRSDRRSRSSTRLGPCTLMANFVASPYR